MFLFTTYSLALLKIFYNCKNDCGTKVHKAIIGLGKIDCNRYSIAIFFTFCSSNALEPFLF